MSILGTRVFRVEDPDLLTVGGKYVDDLAPADAVHATFVRSEMAHGRLGAIDTSEAAMAPGVIGVYTAADLELAAVPPGMPMLNQDMKRSWLAADRVRYVGEPFAVVVSTTRETGVDAAGLVFADYEPLPAVVSPADAVKDETILYPEAGTNVAFAVPTGSDDSYFDGCDVTVSLQFRNQRLAPCPLEPRATVARWEAMEDGREHLTQWSSTQNAHGTRDALAAAMEVETDQVRVICPDVGGGFGAKNGSYAEDLVVSLLARKLGQPVRWAETRSESMLGLVHGRGMDFDATIGGTRDGRITAYRCHATQDAGAHATIGAVLPFIARTVACGVYDIERADFFATSVVTNTVPVGAYRGAGRPEAAAAIERMIEAYAAEVGIDPVEVRRKNFVKPDSFPFTTPTGANMDSGEYDAAMQAVMDHVDYPGLRAEQERRRHDSSAPLLGLGWSAYVEIANPMGNPEFGSIEVRPDGSAVVLTGSSAHGQGHHTAFAQVASDMTGIPFDRIEVRHGDTDEVPRGGGTGGSKSLQVGGSAVLQASEAAVAQAKDLAANLLEADPADIVLDTAAGTFAVTGTPAINVSWADVAGRAHEDQGTNLLATADFDPGAPTFPFGAHLSVVQIDRDTGEVTVLRHISCDDAGTMVNPLLVEGQVHGGVASGIAQALIEEFHYDPNGNPITANFMDYGLVSAAELPSFERIAQETPTPRNPLGAKGIGESGTIGATPAVQNAVIDALAHLGVRHVDIPTTPERVWQIMTEAEEVGHNA
ncbi:MAG: xanthine dehydrogenase family protein molybdopterin-binding subunit [Actinomycetia bacterium]|nr:xanthine dehydrogenase family protein molybdopterin-binding subunit [Actinomycetes bacterium]